MKPWVILLCLILLSGCGATNGNGVRPSQGAQPARRLEGARISVLAGNYQPTFFYGPWQCNKRWWASCERQCAAEGYSLKGCMWLADLKLDWEGRLHAAGGRYAITHCCCNYTPLPPKQNAERRKEWEKIRESFREDWSKKFGQWPVENGKSWPGHHIRDLQHDGSPTDGNNILPSPPDIHAVFNEEYPRCYGGQAPWNSIGPDLPYLDR